MEEVKAFKYLGVWFDGNVQLEKMKEKAGKLAWKNG